MTCNAGLVVSNTGNRRLSAVVVTGDASCTQDLLLPGDVAYCDIKRVIALGDFEAGKAPLSATVTATVLGIVKSRISATAAGMVTLAPRKALKLAMEPSGTFPLVTAAGECCSTQHCQDHALADTAVIHLQTMHLQAMHLQSLP
jgi:hypothetical protein